MQLIVINKLLKDESNGFILMGHDPWKGTQNIHIYCELK